MRIAGKRARPRRWFARSRHFGLHPDCEVYRDPRAFGVTIVSQRNGRCTYEVAEGVSMEEAARLKAMLAGNNNRTLTCNGCHLLHLARNGPDLSRLARPMRVPAELLAEHKTVR